MINHPSAGLAFQEGHRRELLDLAERERRVQAAMARAVGADDAAPAKGFLARLVPNLPSAFRPVGAGAIPTPLYVASEGNPGD